VLGGSRGFQNSVMGGWDGSGMGATRLRGPRSWVNACWSPVSGPGIDDFFAAIAALSCLHLCTEITYRQHSSWIMVSYGIANGKHD
jgi:hypothetical protein